MHRFYHPPLAAFRPPAAAAAALSVGGELSKEESHHAAKVLRLKAGDVITLFDGAGTTASATITAIGSRVTVRFMAVHHQPPVKPRLTIAAAVPKGSRADAMVEQLSQLGCDELVPLRTARSIVDPRDAKLERFQRACIESAKQCGRPHLMSIAPLTTLHELLHRSDHDLRLLALPAAAEPLDSNALRQARQVLALVGPEGGWMDEEIHDARQAGCIAWSLGPHVMRIETAATAAAALVRYLTK